MKIMLKSISAFCLIATGCLSILLIKYGFCWELVIGIIFALGDAIGYYYASREIDKEVAQNEL